MTPKEKAKELVKEYSWNSDKSDAKQCALICVDEILNIYQLDEYAFWKEVKQEIIKL
jgi:uncharacterized protein YydD (DUF2326 family)